MSDTSRHPSAGMRAGRSSGSSRSSAPTTEAPHLSIGEVLGLLLEEFPDVTISKIRFLESQGLIAPERNASGYRKFFEEDVELLRVILREQRENYLPLRVIKDRIDSGEIDPSGEHTMPRGIKNVRPRSGRDDTGAQQRPDNATPAPDHRADGATGGGSDGQAAAQPPATTSPNDVGPAQQPADQVPTTAEATGSASATNAADASAESDVAAASNAAPASGTARPASPGSAPSESVTPASQAPPAAPSDAGAAAGGSYVPAASPGSTGSTESVSGADVAPMLTGAALTLGELSSMVGATPDEVKQLQEYGIVSARESHGEELFGETAVEIVRVAVEFLRAGVDARHLRGWKTAADREASLYEQLIMPLLRQRNPKGRQQAREQVQRLNELGARLRSALMQAALHDELAL